MTFTLHSVVDSVTGLVTSGYVTLSQAYNLLPNYLDHW